MSEDHDVFAQLEEFAAQLRAASKWLHRSQPFSEGYGDLALRAAIGIVEALRSEANMEVWQRFASRADRAELIALAEEVEKSAKTYLKAAADVRRERYRPFCLAEPREGPVETPLSEHLERVRQQLTFSHRIDDLVELVDEVLVAWQLRDERDLRFWLMRFTQEQRLRVRRRIAACIHYLVLEDYRRAGQEWTQLLDRRRALRRQEGIHAGAELTEAMDRNFQVMDSAVVCVGPVELFNLEIDCDPWLRRGWYPNGPEEHEQARRHRAAHCLRAIVLEEAVRRHMANADVWWPEVTA